MKRFQRLCSLGIVFAAYCSSANAEPPLPSLDEIRAHYDLALSSIQTLQYKADIKIERSGVPLVEDPITNIAAELIRDNHKQAIRTTSRSLSGDYLGVNESVFDGLKYSSFTQNTSPNADELHSVAQAIISNDPPAVWRDVWGVEKFQGCLLWGGEKGLLDLLTNRDARINGWDDVGGSTCVRVTFPEYAPLARSVKRRVRTIAWFDPAHSYLPRRIRIDAVPLPSDKREDFREIEVQRFEQVTDQTQPDQTLWMPTAGFSQNPLTTFRAQMSNIVLNAPIPTARFAITYPDGTLIGDHTGSQPKVSFGGGKPPAFLKQLNPPEPTQGPPRPTNTASARPDDNHGIGYQVSIATLLVLSTIFSVWAFRRRRA